MDENRDEIIAAFEQETGHLTLAQLASIALTCGDRADQLITGAQLAMRDAEGESGPAIVVAVADAGAMLHGARAYAATAELVRAVIATRTAR